MSMPLDPLSRLFACLGACLLSLGFAAGCALLPSAEPLPQPSPSAVPPGEFRVIGYLADWNSPQAVIQFDKLTHLNYAFLLPQPDGSLGEVQHPQRLSQLVQEAHASGVKVLIAVGGWGYDDAFEQLAADPQARQRFVANLAAYTAAYELDGVDIDWEYPDPGDSARNFLSLMQALRQALPAESLLTAAVVASGKLAEGIPAEVFPLVDWLNIMAYDRNNQNHSPLDYAQEALDYWLQRGLPRQKAALGVPFYARPDGVPYRLLVAFDPSAASRDETTYQGRQVFYNGIPTLQAKARLALERAAGIMIWELSQDTSGENSLLAAIHQVVRREDSVLP